MEFIEHVYNTFLFTCEKSEIVFDFFKNMKIVAPPARSRFTVKLICNITFGSAVSAFCLLKSAAISSYFEL